MKKVFLLIIHGYQKTAFIWQAPAKYIFGVQQICRFTPTCSQYTYEAVQKYGALKGSWMGIKRIIRCNPWSKGGVDLLP